MNRMILSTITAITLFASTAAISGTNDGNYSNGSNPNSGVTTNSTTMDNNGNMSTTGMDSHVNIQLKTNDGQMVNAIVDENDLKNLKQGDTLQYQGSEQNNANSDMNADPDSSVAQ